MLPLAEARRQILDTVKPLPSETIPVTASEGRIIRGDIPAPIDLPVFDTSAVDGYSVRSGDIRGATPETPVHLSLAARVAAGQPAQLPLSAGECQRIYTGAMVPPGADAVVMQEDTLSDAAAGSRVAVTSGVKPLENIRLRGEDIRSGSTVVADGQRLSFGHIALLSSLGISHMRAGQNPRVSILASGSELREPGDPLAPGQIYESNRSSLDCLLRKNGARTSIRPIIHDDLDSLADAMGAAFEASDAVVTIGGVSVGDFDLIRPALIRLGGEIFFWKVDVRPGKPFVFGKCRGALLFGLPGNPVSASVCCRLLVQPALLAMQGAARPGPGAFPALLGEPLRNSSARPHYMRVRRAEDGRLFSAGVQGAHVLRSLADSHGLVEVPPGQTLAAGSEVSFIPWD